MLCASWWCFHTLVWAESEILPVSHGGRFACRLVMEPFQKPKIFSYAIMPIPSFPQSTVFAVYKWPFSANVCKGKAKVSPSIPSVVHPGCCHRPHPWLLVPAAQGLFWALNQRTKHPANWPRKGNLWRKPNFKVNEFPHPVCNAAAWTLVQVWVCGLERRNCTGEMEMPFTARTMFFAGLSWL